MEAFNNISLKPTELSDLEFFYQFQLDESAIYMAAFTPENPNDKAAYMNKYSALLKDPSITMRTICFGEEIAGSIAKFVMEGDAEITYWIDGKYWGKGIATKALKEFLKIENTRPIFGRVAFDNIGSQKVMEKCGFSKIGHEKSFANARKKEIVEYIYKLSE
ncbi:MAG: GNAT family N-acetyltransferase [Bacteroidales bacterium]|nr:GNAT family N-acetyltransferase [Bacteroidales bacterium]